MPTYEPATSDESVIHMECRATAYKTSAPRLMRQIEGVLSTDEASMGSMPLSMNCTWLGDRDIRIEHCMASRSAGWSLRGESEDRMAYGL